MNYLPNKISLFFCLAIPFSAFGFYFGQFLFSVLLIPLVLINSLNIIKLRFKKKIFIHFVIFFIICFFSGISRFSLETFLLPLLVFFFLIFMFSGTLQIRKPKKYIIISFLVLSVYCFFELFVGLISNDLMFEIEKFLNIKGSTTTYRDIRRLRGGFLEPSVMGLALNFYLMMFLNLTFSNKRNKILIYLLCIFWIVMTFSSAGYAGLLINLLFFIFSRLKNLKFEPKLNLKSLYTFLLSIIIVFVAYNNFFAPIYKAFEKIILIPEVILSGNVAGSVGYRINSLIVAPQFIFEANFFEKLFGTGFSNYSEYLISRFGDNEFSGFYDGSIGNIFSAILLSTGLLGFFSFILFLKNVLSLKNKLVHLQFILITLLSLIGFGDLTSPWIWSIIFLTKMTLQENYE